MPNTPSFNNPIGVHALVWVGDTADASIDVAIRRSVEAGYDLLELSLHDLDNLNVARTRAALEKAGLTVACSRGLAFDADVSSEDTRVVEKGAKLLAASLEATAGLGAKVLTGALFSALGKYGAPMSDAGRRNAVSVLRDLSADAARLGVTLGLEVCNRYETNVANTAAQAVALADEIGTDNLMIHLDTYHMNIEEDDLVRPLHIAGERLGYVHIGENHRGLLGSGQIDFARFFHALDDIGYAGPLTFESFSSSVVAQGLSNDLAIWRDLWSDGGEIAAHARGFIAAHVKAARARPSSGRARS